MKKTTDKQLPQEIKELIPEKERTQLIRQIIEEAEGGEFHDFFTEKYATPKMQLRAMLLATKDKRLIPVANAVMNGDYDEPSSAIK